MANRTLVGAALCAAAVAAVFGLALVGAWMSRSDLSDLPDMRVHALSFARLPGWDADAQGQALPAFVRACGRLSGRDPRAALGVHVRSERLADLFGTVEDWRAVCAAAGRIDAQDTAAARHFFETWFVPVRIRESARRAGLLTGYYEPRLEGSRRRSAAFPVPLLRRPPDLVQVELGDFSDDLKGERVSGRVVDRRLRPYHTRAQIRAGSLDMEALALAWVDDPVDAFFLQIQGSGRVVLRDGGVLRVGFAGQNGHAYSAIGRILVERGALALEDVSMQSIRAWLDDHPDEAEALMDANRSYVFFREIPVSNPSLGPLGAQGVPLTPERSLAVDRRYYALGLPFWLDAAVSMPETGARALQRLVVAQDTGGAIRGAQRGDYFVGFGDEAGETAGRMRAEARFYALVLRALAERRP